MDTYSVADQKTRERLGALAQRANRRRREGWWHQYGSVLAETYLDYIEMEDICDRIRTFQVQLVPGLLQTAEYGRAVTVASRAWHSAEEVEQFVQVRLARQERLTGERKLELWAVLAEGVLRQQVGGPTMMRDQLEHLADMAEQSNITVQVLPFSRGAHSGMYGPYLLMSFPRIAAQNLVLIETPTGTIWMEQDSEVARYMELFDDARTSALPPTESLGLIRRMAHSPAHDLTATSWRAGSYSGGQGKCVEVSDGVPGRVPVRGSKRPGGPVIGFGVGAWEAFVTYVH
ncbi:DUF397 domain-containing protein [Streptomyces sp. NPDC056367]|uniref:DUF397 domain-containing protein n=1 Tax=Streptomyces sp. NPDC056367 TaxID=3345797 RepID=UPI0035DE9022